ncbi:2105_t:CDS:2, partial [Racocetra persica]
VGEVLVEINSILIDIKLTCILKDLSVLNEYFSAIGLTESVNLNSLQTRWSPNEYYTTIDSSKNINLNSPQTSWSHSEYSVKLGSSKSNDLNVSL